MSLKSSKVRWGRVALGTALAVVAYIVLQIVINVGYGVVIGFQLRGSPPPEMLNEAFTSTPFVVLYVVEVAVGGIIGGWLAGRRGLHDFEEMLDEILNRGPRAEGGNR